MTLTLYSHPFSSYCQKVLVALYENDTPFTYRHMEHEGAGETFSMADCAAAPSLFYADWVRQISEAFPAVRAYRARLLARPSMARCVEEARPYRHYFPLGAPDRD